MKNLGLLKILATAATLISSSAPNRRLFSHLAASLFLPFSLLFLLQNYLDYLLSGSGKPAVLFYYLSILPLLFLSVLPASAVALSVASLLTTTEGPPFSPNLIFSLLPKLQKPLLSTSLAALRYLLIYTLISLALFTAIGHLLDHPHTASIRLALLLAVALFYFYGMVQLGATWLVATVMSVMEDSCGNAAIDKSQKLLGWNISKNMSLFFAALSALYLEAGRKFTLYVLEEDRRRNSLGEVLWEGRWVTVVVEGVKLGFWARFGIGLGFAALLTVVSLFGMVAFTLFYFVRKRSSREGLDMSSLADRLKLLEGRDKIN